jgi:hypothetical protein
VSCDSCQLSFSSFHPICLCRSTTMSQIGERPTALPTFRPRIIVGLSIGAFDIPFGHCSLSPALRLCSSLLFSCIYASPFVLLSNIYFVWATTHIHIRKSTVNSALGPLSCCYLRWGFVPLLPRITPPCLPLQPPHNSGRSPIERGSIRHRDRPSRVYLGRIHEWTRAIRRILV